MKIFISIAFLILSLTGLAGTEYKCSHHRLADPGRPLSPLPTVDILDYNLFFDFTGNDEKLHGEAVIKFLTVENIERLNLQLLQLKVEDIYYHGKKVKHVQDNQELSISFPEIVPQGSTDSVRIVYSGTPVIDASDFGGFYFRNDFMFNMGVAFIDQPHVYGRSWFPCVDNFTDRATFQFRIRTNEGFRGYANGSRQWEKEMNEGMREVKWVLHQEIPTYLAAIYAGQYKDHESLYHSTLQNKDIPVMLVTRPTEMGKAKGSFRNLNKLMEHYERLYGPYVWEKIGYALVPFDAGAMEHATLIAYPMDNADGSLDHEDLMAHELSHHWWGNWVTCKSAKEMWINEGMASYSECLFYEALYGKEAYMKEMRANHYAVLQKAHFYDGGHFALNNVPGDATYGIHSYKKGADVVHSMRSYMGDSLFFEGLRYIQKMYGGKNISSEEFNACMSKFNPIADQFFSDWVYRGGGSCLMLREFQTNEENGKYITTAKVDQITRGNISFYDDIPVTITLMDSNFNRLDVIKTIPGLAGRSLNISSDFKPSFVGINLDERLSLATTAKMERISSAGNKNWKYANCEVEIEKVHQEAFLLIEQHWVSATSKPTASSFERFWNVDGIGLEKLEGSIDFHFNGELSASGLLDAGLFQSNEGKSDKVVLYYREKPLEDWKLHPEFEVVPDGDLKGLVRVNSIRKGQYLLGIKL